MPERLNFHVPPLSDSFSRLLSLNDAQRGDLRLLELLAQKDPGATLRLQQLANTAYFRGTEDVKTLKAALLRLGADNAVGALLSMWSVDELEVSTELVPARNWLTRHIFSLCATMRKLLLGADLLDDVPFAQLQAAAVLDKMAYATLLSVKETDLQLRDELLQQVAADNHALHLADGLHEVAQRGEQLARQWQLDARIVAFLAEFSRWNGDWSQASQGMQALVLSELLLAKADEQEEGAGADALDAAYESSEVMQQLVNRRINAASLRASI